MHRALFKPDMTAEGPNTTSERYESLVYPMKVDDVVLPVGLLVDLRIALRARSRLTLVID